MKTSSLFWALGWLAAGSLAIVPGCGGDDDDNGGTSTGGKGGTSSGGKGGTSTGGKGGTAGTSTGGKGGTAGTSTGGSGGTSGTMGGEGGAVVGGEGGGGPGGDRAAACSDYCDTYYDSMCETFPATNIYANIAQCNDICNMAIWVLGEPGDAMGSSVHCRLTHAGLAAGGDETHCGHASATSTGNCVD